MLWKVGIKPGAKKIERWVMEGDGELKGSLTYSEIYWSWTGGAT